MKVLNSVLLFLFCVALVHSEKENEKSIKRKRKIRLRGKASEQQSSQGMEDSEYRNWYDDYGGYGGFQPTQEVVKDKPKEEEGGGIFSTIVDTAGGLYDAVEHGASSAYQATKDFASQGYNAIEETLSKGYNALESGISKGVNAVAKGLDSVVDTVWGWFNPFTYIAHGRSAETGLTNDEFNRAAAVNNMQLEFVTSLFFDEKGNLRNAKDMDRVKSYLNAYFKSLKDAVNLSAISEKQRAALVESMEQIRKLIQRLQK